MADPFVHLHVASGYSLRYGASHPQALVQRAAEHGMQTLALTDRDGVYGAVRFVQACQSAGVRPVLGVDLAYEPVALEHTGPARRPGSGRPGAARSTGGRAAGGGATGGRAAGGRATGGGGTGPDGHRAGAGRATPARGGAEVDLRLPRVTLLACDGRGWASLSRLLSATHLRGERGRPVSTVELLAAHNPGLLVLLGPSSEVGRATAARRPDLAAAHLHRWRQTWESRGGDPGDLLVEVVHHRARDDREQAGRLLGFAAEQHATAVLTNAVRYADRADAPVADVLDAARRLVPLGARNVDRSTAEGYLKSGKEMGLVAEELCGPDRDAVRRLLATTGRIADRCALDPRADLGLGEVHFPELDVLSGAAGPVPVGVRTPGAGAGSRSARVPRPQGAGPDGFGRRSRPGSGGPAVVPASERTAVAGAVLRARCEAGLGRRGMAATGEVRQRLDHELDIIATLGYPSYFLTVADVADLIRSMGVRAAARGSGAGSLVTYLLGISDVDPIRYRLLMERFLSPLRQALPDIDIDVESARRGEVYEAVLERFGGDRCACVSMMDTYRARHAIRDVGAALGMPPGEIDTIAKSFPHIRASQLTQALHDLPELRASGLGEARLSTLFSLAERLDGLPRHVALHPCGVLLSDATLLDRTPVEASYLGYPMSQFDKDDVESLGLLKLDLLGIRMQSAIAYALTEIKRVDGDSVDIDTVPRDDPATFALVRSTRTLGCFQIESPGQRELVGKFGPETFEDIITDISLFRPGPVKSDMVTPFLEARNGWADARYLHPDLAGALEQTCGVVVFHEQVLEIVAVLTGVTLAEADEVRRALGSPDGQEEVRVWFHPAALARGYDLATVERAWAVLKAFGSFGFCKAHAAAFALPTYQSAWLKAHHPAAFLAGVLTHDPGMYPKRLILDDARQFGIAILSLDVNDSGPGYRVERVGPLDEPPPEILGQPPRQRPEWLPEILPDARCYGIRLGLDDVKGITDAEVTRIVAGQPYRSLADFWHRAGVSRPIAERLVVAGGLDSLYGIGSSAPVRRRGRITRRDLLLQVLELDRWSRGVQRSARRVNPAGRRAPSTDTWVTGPTDVRPSGGGQPASTDVRPSGGGQPASTDVRPSGGGQPASTDARPSTGGRPESMDTRSLSTGDTSVSTRDGASAAGKEPFAESGAHPDGLGAPFGAQTPTGDGRGAGADVRGLAARQSRAAAPVQPVDVQLTLDLGDDPSTVEPSGLPEMTDSERVRAELEVLGLDASRHVVDFYEPFLAAFGTTRAGDLLRCRSKAEVFVAGVKVATQTPPIRSGRRVVFVTLDDATGCADATFFEDVQGPYAMTVFHSWLLVIRGEVRRTGPRGVSLRATGAWELPMLREAWELGGLPEVRAAMAMEAELTEQSVTGAAQSRSARPVMHRPPVGTAEKGRPVLVHSTGFKLSPYADIKPAGGSSKEAPRKLWHSSPGSSGG